MVPTEHPELPLPAWSGTEKRKLPDRGPGRLRSSKRCGHPVKRRWRVHVAATPRGNRLGAQRRLTILRTTLERETSAFSGRLATSGRHSTERAHRGSSAAPGAGDKRLQPPKEKRADRKIAGALPFRRSGLDCGYRANFPGRSGPNPASLLPRLSRNPRGGDGGVLPHVAVGGHDELADFGERGIRRRARDFEECGLRRTGVAVHEVEDRALMLADDRGVGLRGEIANRRRVPVVAARHAAALVHALLYHGPLAPGSHDEGVEVDLEPVIDGVVVDARGEAAGADQRFAIEAAALGDRAQFVGSIARVAPAAAANVDAEFVGARIEAALESSRTVVMPGASPCLPSPMPETRTGR